MWTFEFNTLNKVGDFQSMCQYAKKNLHFLDLNYT